MSLRSVNLNLLPILRALLNERGVSRAAKVLSMSQAATSEALAQLRIVLDDPLLVRVGTGMVLTPRAVELTAEVERLCDAIDLMLAKRSFDPATAQRTFVVATTDHLVYLLGPPLIKRVGELAPKAEIHFVNWTGDAVERLAAREVHFFLMPRFVIDDLSPAPIRLKTLFEDTMVLIFSVGHPLENKPTISEDDLAAYRHVTFNLDHLEHKRARATAANRFNAIARVWPLMLAPQMLPGTDYLSMVPKSLALRMVHELPLRWRYLPSNPAEIHPCLAWSTLMDADAGHHWFKTVVENVVQEIANVAQAADT